MASKSIKLPVINRVVFEIWTLLPGYAMLITSSGGRSHGSDCCDLPILSK